jgi:hypothetical protein
MVRLVNPDRARARNYTSRREQWRLMLLILPLGLVIILMARLRDPETANRINPFFAPVPEQDAAINPEPAVANVAPRAAAGLFPGIDPDLLKTVRDDTYFRNAEKDAWFHFFKRLQDTSQAELAKMHSLEANYVQLVDQPNFYRGKLVIVYGYLRQVTEQKPAANDLGINSYYRVVVEPTDDIDWPIIVYCLELPPNVRVGDDLFSNMKVVGLFFKKLSYQWKEGMGTAPVLVARTIEDFGAGPGMPGMRDMRAPVPADRWADTEEDQPEASQAAAKPAVSEAAFRDLLSLAGWDVEQLAEFDDGKRFTDEQRKQTVELLRRLRSFDAASLADWTHDGLHFFEVVRQPDDYRGQLVRLQGRVTEVTRHNLSPDDAQRLEMPEYYECKIVLTDESAASTLLATRVPKAWLSANIIDEPASASALYLKRFGKDETSPAVWLTKEVGWHPGNSLSPDNKTFGPSIAELFGKNGDPRFGISLLGNLGVDVGLLDDVQSRGRIRAEEREAFYQIMQAVGNFNPTIYADIAQATLAAVRKDWDKKLAAEKDPKRRALAKAASDRAKEGRYSVAPLFNEPENQIGRLIVVDGRARRAVRVEVGEKPGGGQSDVARRFGIDHYYELEVFTDDSQNYPLVFCVRSLPENFPREGVFDVPVRVAGFFFKDWLYRTRHAEDDNAVDGGQGTAGRAQYAPLLIGPEPAVLASPERAIRGAGQLIGGVLFMIAVASILGVAWWLARSDRRQQFSATSYEVPPGQSLNDLNLPVE